MKRQETDNAEAQSTLRIAEESEEVSTEGAEIGAQRALREMHDGDLD